MTRYLRQAAFAACLATLASPAVADRVTVRVSYADLDLTSPDDVAALHDRLAATLRQACKKDLPNVSAAQQVSEDCVASGLRNGEEVIAEHRDRARAAVP